MNERIADVAVVEVKPNAVEAAHRGLLDRMFAASHDHPRDIAQCRERSLAAVLDDPETPGECIYTIPRDGKEIIGPSVRFAEIIANAWGNLFTQSMIVEEADRFVTAQAWAMDTETGCCNAVTRRRRIVGRGGKRYNDDMIQMTANAAESIAFRAAVLRTVPKPFWRPIYSRAIELASGGPEVSDETIERLVAWYAEHGVSVGQIESFLRIEAIDFITPRHVLVLRGMATAALSGELDLARVFRPHEPRERALEPADAPEDTGDADLEQLIDEALGGGDGAAH